MYKKTLLAASLLASLPAFAAKFYLVAPLTPMNRTSPAESISVSLNAYALPAGVVGRAYTGFDFNSVLQVAGDPSFDPGNVRWALVGGALPDGVTLSDAGQLEGTPTAASTASFQVMANYKTKSGQLAYQLVVGEVNIGLAEATLPAGVQGAAYSYDLKPRLAVSGDPDFTPSSVNWSLVSGTLPAGLQLNSDGTLSGTPAAEGTHPFTVQASYLGRNGEREYQIVVGAITISLASATPQAGVVGKAYSGFDLKPQLSVAGDAAYAGDGSGVVWALASGSLPPGLTLNATTGEIAGTPTARGAGPVQVKATYKAKTATQSYTIPLSDSIKQFSGYRAWSDGTLAASCLEYLQGKAGYSYDGATGDGIYRIDVDGAGALTPVDVQCDMTTDGGGWTVFQSRVNGSVDFYRTYAEYAAGFGSAATEYWLGNNRLAAMTATARTLRVDMQRTNGQTAYAQYSSFKVNGAADGYRLTLSGYSGTAGDSLGGHTGLRFTTKDVDQDTLAEGNCANSFAGAWWYSECHSSNLNGLYLNGPTDIYARGIVWYHFAGHYESLKVSKMKVR